LSCLIWRSVPVAADLRHYDVTMLSEDGSGNSTCTASVEVVRLEAGESALGAIGDVNSSGTEDGLASKVDLALLGKMGVAATGLAYVIGVFSTNAYLQEYKVADFDLLRPRLVFSGVLALSFLGSIVGMVQIVALVVRSRRASWFARILALLFLSLLAILGPGLQLASHVPATAVGAQVGWGVTMVTAAFFLFSLIRLNEAGDALRSALRKLSITGRAAKDGLAQNTLALGLATILAMATLQFLYLFAKFSLPNMPVQYGGLASRPALLVAASDDAVRSLREAGVRMNGGTTSPVALVYEGQSYFLIGVQNGNITGNILRVRKEDIASIIIAKRDLNDVINKPIG
jgi:hypothetical protein